MNASPFMLSGYHTKVERVVVGGRSYDLLVPADPDGLLDDPRVAERFESDEYMPYWATLWPAAFGLAEYVAGRRDEGAVVSW